VIDPTLNVIRELGSAIKRIDDLHALDAKWRDRLEQREIDHAWDLRKAESDRIDAIRAVDVGNVQRAAEVQATQALALANQVVATATALETKLGATVAPLQTRIDDLTRVQYEGVGSKDRGVESRAGISSVTIVVGAIVGLFFLFLAFISTALSVYVALKK
jgi:hypothetical protein